MSRQSDFIDFFNSLPDWQERYQYIIELGNKLPAMPEHLKVQGNRIQNCPSKLFFHVSHGLGVRIQADGNSPISLGLAGMLAHIFNDITAEQLMWEPNDFMTETGLLDHLTPQRQFALQEMVRRLRQ